MTGAAWSIRGDRLSLDRPGRPKFVDRVDEVTFCGARGLADGKQVYYVTNVGVFQLAPEGLVMTWRMPGVDVERDVLGHSGARLVVPENVPVVDTSVVTGAGFRLQWPTRT